MNQPKFGSEAITDFDKDSIVEDDTSDETRSAASVPVVTPTPNRSRPMKKLRFLAGMLLSAHGIALVLAVAAGALQKYGVSGRLSLPVVGLCMIMGVMMLGGGFGIMATSAGTFDDDEFERLMVDGDVTLPKPVGRTGVSDLPAFRDEVDRSVTEFPTRSEQSVA